MITGGAFEASDERRAAVLKPLDMLTTAGANADIAAALNTLPGTTRVGEEGKLFVRGGRRPKPAPTSTACPCKAPTPGP
ncbi:MAG: hypothetical protein WKG07_43365 [Hymenobacter sp.]